ncbi:hypothetical protein [Mesorhizobium sp.]|uniref:hypothetical protein n=1 Tax=Mesorhizobium sp. TaxID=1871066 RepID=UPI000FE8CC9A|nr:hypothetical protein [Mesorhizobium sp.]RWD70272.1 MAG: hypothetical protein EOS37_15220 [Mesorhizobium sp.]
MYTHVPAPGKVVLIYLKASEADSTPNDANAGGNRFASTSGAFISRLERAQLQEASPNWNPHFVAKTPGLGRRPIYRNHFTKAHIRYQFNSGLIGRLKL